MMDNEELREELFNANADLETAQAQLAEQKEACEGLMIIANKRNAELEKDLLTGDKLLKKAEATTTTQLETIKILRENIAELLEQVDQIRPLSKEIRAIATEIKNEHIAGWGNGLCAIADIIEQALGEK